MRRSHTNRHRPLLLAVLAAAMALPVFAVPVAAAQEAALEHPDAVVSPAAREVLARMKTYLNSLDSFTVDAQASRDELLAYGYKLQNNEWARMTVQRPKRMRVDVDGDIKKRSYYYDGSTLTMFAPDENVYSRVPAPGTIREVVDQLHMRGVEMPLIDILGQAYQGTLLQDVRVGLKVQDTMVDGVAAEHL